MSAKFYAFARYICVGVLPLFFLLACATSGVRFTGKILKPKAIFYFSCSEKVVALSIDDGPDTRYTSKILDSLDDHSASATFFIVGERARPDLLTLISNSNSELGNHAYSEQALTDQSLKSAAKNISDTHNIIKRFQEPRWFRPPKGRYNSEILELDILKDYSLALGDVYPLDHLISSAAFSTWYIKTYVKKGSIIVLHEENDRGERTLKALNSLLPKLKERGYKVLSLTELSEYNGCRAAPNGPAKIEPS